MLKLLVYVSIFFVTALQERDGNFPIALASEKQRNTEKRLIHWCHGAPGAFYFLAKAYSIFNDNRYLDACKKSADLIWKYGLLKKGSGICHGIAGNGYVFLILFQLTDDQTYLYRATKFAEFLTNVQYMRESRTPDRPYSLYEGKAGAVCFLIDLLRINEAAGFPFMKITR